MTSDNSTQQVIRVAEVPKQIYEKAIRILAAIDNCNCPHCNLLLKQGLSDELTAGS